MKKECLAYLEIEKTKLVEEFPKYKPVTEELFSMVIDFICSDFEGVPENKIYRSFLTMMKDIIYYAFDNGSSKIYMRTFFKVLNNSFLTDYIVNLVKSKSSDIKAVMNRFVNFFVYWQNSDNTRDRKLNEIIDYVNEWV